MAMKTKAATKRTKVKDLPKSKRQLTGKDLKKIKGGVDTTSDSKDSKHPGEIELESFRIRH